MKWLPTPTFLPSESHGQRSLMGYSPWSHKELYTTEQLSILWQYTYTHTHTHTCVYTYKHTYTQTQTLWAWELRIHSDTVFWIRGTYYAGLLVIVKHSVSPFFRGAQSHTSHLVCGAAWTLTRWRTTWNMRCSLPSRYFSIITTTTCPPTTLLITQFSTIYLRR